MKICEIIYSLQCGGAETFAATISTELADIGHEVTLLLLDRSANTDFERSRLEQLRRHGVTVFFLNRQPGNPFSLLAAIFRLVLILRKGRYEAIHSHLVWCDIAAFLAAKLIGWHGKVVSTIHSTVLIPQSQCMGRWWRKALRGMRPVFCSESVWRKYRDEIPGGLCIPNGVAVPQGSDEEAEEFLRVHGIPSRGCRILLAAGSLYEVKAQDRLIQAMPELLKQYPDVLLLLCGEGRLRSEYQALIERLHLKNCVFMPGICMCIPALLKRAELFVSASTYEGLPISVLEALFAGTPAVLSPISSHEELHREVGGIMLADGMTASNMTAALAQALEHRKELSTRLRASAATLNKHSIRHCAEQYLYLFEKYGNQHG